MRWYSAAQGAVAAFSAAGNLEQNLFQNRFRLQLGNRYIRRHPPAASKPPKRVSRRSIEDRRSVLVTLLGDVAKNYIDLRGLQRRLAVAQDNLQAQQDTLDLTKIRFDAGLASDFEVAQAEGEVKTTAGADSNLADRLETDGVPHRYFARRAAGGVVGRTRERSADSRATA